MNSLLIANILQQLNNQLAKTNLVAHDCNFVVNHINLHDIMNLLKKRNQSIQLVSSFKINETIFIDELVKELSHCGFTELLSPDLIPIQNLPLTLFVFKINQFVY